VALLLIVDVVALVLAAILPGEDTIALHLVLFPAADVGTIVCPLVGALTLDLVA
jgi:hypothetical protein